jgi:hypothetical protein
VRLVARGLGADATALIDAALTKLEAANPDRAEVVKL